MRNNHHTDKGPRAAKRPLDPRLLPVVKLLARLLVDEHDAGKLATAPKTGQTPAT